MKIVFNILLFFSFLASHTAYAQNDLKKEIQDIADRVTMLADSNSAEKTYIHTDKSFYINSDTIWFKIYLFNAPFLTASEKSGISYLEIANEQNEVVKRVMVSMYMGLGWGQIALDKKDFPEGAYTLRAYTNWMRNFDENYIFKKQFYIYSTNEKDLLIHSDIGFIEEMGKQKATVKLRLSKIDQKPLIKNDFQVKIVEGKKVWFKDNDQASSNGSLAFNFDIPEKSAPDKLYINLQPLNKNEENTVYTIPVILNRPENTDLQFMPEGGYLVEGIDAHIAFKALNEDGTGANVSGSVYNSREQEVLSFQSTHSGMGSFYLNPQPGETYNARIKLPNGKYSKLYPLPIVQSSGLVLNVLNQFGSDSLEINVSAKIDSQYSNPVFYLIGQSRGVACYGAIVSLKQNGIKTKIIKTAFPTGVARLTLLNADKQVLNERIVYIDHDDHLRVNVSGDKEYYSTRDSVGMSIEIKDKNGDPVSGDFSVSVTDDAQAKYDSLKSSSLKSVILLTSDLKGTIENPGYYFPPVSTKEINDHLDNLLLTQGWVNYDWQSVFQPIKPAMNLAEASFSIKGEVTNVFNKPVKNSGVILLSHKPFFLVSSSTNDKGTFNFKNIYPTDTAVYLIQARNKRGKSFNIGIEVEEFKPPVFSTSNERILPWYVNMDSNRIKAINTIIAYQKDWEKLTGGKVLKEIIIAGRKKIEDSKNLNDDGGSDFALTKEDLQKAGKATLGDLLMKNIKGFRRGGIRSASQYFIDGKQVHLIIDGIDIDFGARIIDPGPPSEFPPSLSSNVEQFLNYYMAEDIKGIEVMKSSKYSGRYFQTFQVPLRGSPFDHAYIEITTYGGVGPFLKSTPGIYRYRPMPFAPDIQFYSPKYLSRDDHSFVDNRSTIFWSPNIVSDKNGKAAFSFYTADRPGTYTVLIEGCDMNGNIESTVRKIIVK